MPERDMESLGVMGWGLAAAENSGVGVVTGGEGGGGPLDFREIICFFGNYQTSVILLMYTGKKSKTSKI